MPLAANPLIQVTPGLMIWTIVCFLITLFVLKRYAFGPIQKAIDERRERIRQSIEEADHAREEARKLLEEHKKLIGRAKTDAEEILAEARRIAEANERRMRDELETDRQRRLEETRKQIEAETRRALEQIRLEVVDLPRADECCGFGGTFAIKNAETSSAMLTDKCDAIESTSAEFCTAVDSSCLLQIGGGLSRRGSAVRPIHIAEILAST